MKKPKFLALLMTAALCAGSLTGCGSGDISEKVTTAAVNEVFSNDKVLQETVEKVINAGSSNARKEETVYVKTAPDGTVNSIIVSDWLKNTEGTEELTDTSNLTGITNVKGDETYTRDGEALVWKANGSDIYYQGTIDKQLPVEMKMTYTLDGKEIAPAELAGKSGHVVITISYINNDFKKVQIGNKEETIYTPYAAVSGLRLDNRKFTNVAVSGGNVISDGNNALVIGMAFPGLADSLNGSSTENGELLEKLEEKMNIPSEIVIEADAENFELGMVFTMVSADVANILGLDSIDTDDSGTLADMKDSVETFKNAGNDLQDGTSKLQDGAQALSNGTSSLSDGSSTLYQGVVSYTDGVSKVAGGAGTLASGAVQLDNGAASLQSGIGQLSGGVETLKAGAEELNAGVSNLKDGTASASTGAQSLKSGAESVSAGVDSLVGQVQDIAGGMGQAADAAAKISGGIDALVNAVSTETTADDAAIQNISVTGLVDSSTAAAVIWGNVPVDSLRAMGLTEEQIEGVRQIISGVAGSAVPQIVDQAATGAARQAALQSANSVKSALYAAMTQSASGTGLQAGAAALSSSLNSSYQQMADPSTAAALQTLKNGAAGVAQGAGSLADGIAQLDNGAAALLQGTTRLTGGVSALQSGAATLSAGAAELKAGTGSLRSGAATLSAGVGELNANSATLLEGSKSLADGAKLLKNGAAELLDGTVTLHDGMIRFNEEGVEKLTDIFDTDVDVMSQRIKAIVEAGRNHASFSGSGAEEDTTVKYIIEAEGISR